MSKRSKLHVKTNIQKLAIGTEHEYFLRLSYLLRHEIAYRRQGIGESYPLESVDLIFGDNAARDVLLKSFLALAPTIRPYTGKRL